MSGNHKKPARRNEHLSRLNGDRQLGAKWIKYFKTEQIVDIEQRTTGIKLVHSQQPTPQKYMKSITKDSLELLKSWSQEFEATINRVRHLIGSSHWLSDGKHKEAIITNFLKKYTLENYTISSGFIVSHEPGIPSSGEIDVLVSRRGIGIPWFYDSGILITPPENVLAHIHVKSAYQKQQLFDIFDSTKKACLAISKEGTNPEKLRKTWAAGFFFSEEGKVSLQTLKSHIEEKLESIDDPSTLPNAIFLHPSISIIIDKYDKKTVNVKLIKAKHLSAALFLCYFVESVVPTGSTEIGDLLYNQEGDEIENIKIEIKGDN